MKCLIFVLIVGSVAYANNKDAINSAEAWIQLVDAGNYDGSWDVAATFFKERVSKADWKKTATLARQPLGKLISRKQKSANRLTQLPGAPDGDYVVIQYDAVYEHKKSAKELITPMLDKDKKWKVSGYVIH